MSKHNNTTLRKTYSKRSGTVSGMCGYQLEMSLTSLILFRLKRNNDIEEFCLGSNINGIGSYDDICIRLKLPNNEKPILLFIQSKYKENENCFLEFEITKEWCKSFCKVKERYNLNEDVFFNGNFYNTECIFVLYTNAGYCVDSNNGAGITTTKQATAQGGSSGASIPKQAWKKYESSLSNLLNCLISTNDNSISYHVNYTNETENINWAELATLNEEILEEELTALAHSLSRFLAPNRKNSMYITTNAYISRYHIVLAQKVVKISGIYSKKSHYWRTLEFRPDFLDTEDKILANLRKKIYIQILNIDETTASLNETDVKAAREQLSKVNIEVPITFGNLDIRIRNNGKKKLEKINNLKDLIEKLCREFVLNNQDHKVVTLKEDEFLPLSCTLGNLIIFDTDSKSLKFSQDPTGLEENAKSLLNKLQVDELDSYRFVVKAVKSLPKLDFDYIDEIQLLLKDVVVYEKQSNAVDVEKKLKNEIEAYEEYNPHHDKCETILSRYLKEIHEWWSELEEVKYLSKSEDIYELVKSSIVTAPRDIPTPQMNAMKITFEVTNRNFFGYEFDEIPINSLGSLEANLTTIIETNVSITTTVKVIQYFKSKNINKYTIFDFKNVLELGHDEFNAFCTELEHPEHTLINIVVCDNTENKEKLNTQFQNIAEAINTKKTIVIIDTSLVQIAEIYFTEANKLYDLKQSLIDLTPASQEVIKNTKAIFQSRLVNFSMFVDVVSVEGIKGTLFSKMVSGETISIGNSHSILQDERIRNSNRVNQTLYYKYVLEKTFSGVVLRQPNWEDENMTPSNELWTVRINLPDHWLIFRNWKDNTTPIDTLKTLTFMCQIIQNNSAPFDLEEFEGKIRLKEDTGDELVTFELNMFLHFYNNGKLKILFHGLDLMYSLYRDIVFTFLKVVLEYPGKNQMLVTSEEMAIISDLTSNLSDNNTDTEI